MFVVNRPTTYTKTDDPQLTPIGLAIDAFLIDRKASNLSPRTISCYQERLAKFAKWLSTQDVAYVEQITPTHIRTHFVDMQERGLSEWTVRGQATVIKTFSRWLVQDEWLTKSPMRGVRMPKSPKGVLPALSRETIDKLLDTADKRDYALVLFLLDTGCRAAECCKLDAGDIDLSTGAVSIDKGKGGKNRVVYVGARTRKALVKYWREAYSGYPKPKDPAWLGVDYRSRLEYEGIRTAIRRLSLNAGVKVTPHAFRRTFALWSLRAGMDIYSLQRIMGHQDLQMLRQYLDLDDTDTAIAHERFGAVDTILSNSKKKGTGRP